MKSISRAALIQAQQPSQTELHGRKGSENVLHPTIHHHHHTTATRVQSQPFILPPVPIPTRPSYVNVRVAPGIMQQQPRWGFVHQT